MKLNFEYTDPCVFFKKKITAAGIEKKKMK